MLLQLLTSWKNALTSVAANASARAKESPESNGSKKIDIVSFHCNITLF